MSVCQILKSDAINCNVPDERKAAAEEACVESEITPLVPATIAAAQQVTLYLRSAHDCPAYNKVQRELAGDEKLE